jgi:hypothetical protein
MEVWYITFFVHEYFLLFFLNENVGTKVCPGGVALGPGNAPCLVLFS